MERIEQLIKVVIVGVVVIPLITLFRYWIGYLIGGLVVWFGAPDNLNGISTMILFGLLAVIAGFFKEIDIDI